jgi:hypothetical protein
MTDVSPTSNRFVILSGSRSGTTLLCDTLNSHPDILCHGEPFHPAPYDHLRGDMGGLDVEGAVALRERDPQAFLTWVYNHPEVKTVGFKMWQSHAPDICEQLMADPSMPKIIYERPNVLARFSSSRLVWKTGVHNIKLGNARSDTLDHLLDFHTKTFVEYLRQHTEMFAHYRAASVGPVLDITFDSIKGGDYAQVLGYLGMENMALVPQNIKLHTSSIIDRYNPAHHNAIRVVLNDLGHPEWVSE